MGERLTTHGRHLGRKAGAILLGASLVLGLEQTSHAEPPTGNHERTAYDSDFKINRTLSSQILAAAVLDRDTHRYVVVRDDISPAHMNAFRETLRDPIVEFGAEMDVAPNIYITRANNDNDSPFDDANGIFSLVDNHIELRMELEPDGTPKGLYQTPDAIKNILPHEELHGLNKWWYAALLDRQDRNDPDFLIKAKRLVKACVALNKDIVRDYMSTNADDLADSFEESVDIKKVYPNYETDPDSREDADKYGRSLSMAATTIRNNDPSIYDSNVFVYPTCQEVDVVTLLSKLGNIDEEELYAWIAINDNYEDLEKAYKTLAGSYANAYSCVNEGNVLSPQSKSLAIIGHAQTNTSEMASSLPQTLRINPRYITTCLDQLPPRRSALLREYIDATLEIVFSHSEVEDILRSNPETSLVIDELRATP